MGHALPGRAAARRGHSAIPDDVAVYPVPWAGTASLAPKSFVSAGRIAALGIGQLGAVTAMARSARDVAPWARFWAWAGFTAGFKTLIECAGVFAAQGTPYDRLALALVGAAVGAFAIAALRWWSSGALRQLPAAPARPGWLLAALALWALSAVAPRLF